MNITDKLETEEKELASMSQRAISFTIDDIIISILILIAHYDMLTKFEISSTQEIMNYLSSIMMQLYFLKVAYDGFFVWLYGATPGKMIMSIKVVSIYDLEKPDLIFSIIRSVGKIISTLLFYLGFLWAFYDKNNMSWQDKAAKTIVIKD